MIEAVLEVVLEVLGELLLQLFGEMLVQFGIRGVTKSLEYGSKNTVAAIFGHVLLGAAIGAISLLAFPSHLVRDPTLRLVNAIASPLIAGVCMATIGGLLRRRGRATVRIESFGYGVAFAAAFALVRFAFAG